MPSIKGIAGAAAIARISRQIPDDTRLRSRIRGKAGASANITSCNYTAEVLADVISPFVKIKGFEEKATQREKIVKIKEWLQDSRPPKMVYIYIIPDHHFIVFPTDNDRVLIQQSFQDTYNLIEWRRHGAQYLQLGDFIGLMVAAFIEKK
jgi:hypothetical protein